MKSMTGFGRGEFRDEMTAVTVEVKTVNHRYLDFFLKVPRCLSANEERIRKAVSAVLARGHVEIYIRYQELGKGAVTLNVNKGLATEYIRAMQQLRGLDADVSHEIDVNVLARFPDVIESVPVAIDDAQVWQKVSPALSEALSHVVTGRVREGAAMAADISMRREKLVAMVAQIAEKAPQLVATYEQNLRARVSEYLAGAEIDDQRILTEVAIMGDRLAIDEEIARLNTHLDRLGEMIESTQPIGRKMDFLIQEINRETNTIGSKVCDADIAGMVVDMKNEIEKIREQVQNIE